MSISLRSYVQTHCDRHPAARMKLVEFARAFRASLPAADRAAWTRSRILSELAAEFHLVQIDRVMHIQGVLPRANALQAA